MKETNGCKIVERIDYALHQKGENDRVQLCKIAEIPKQTITNWSMRGTMPKVDDCLRIAKYLNVSIEWLVYGNEEPKALDPLIAKIQKLTPEQKEDVEDLVDVKLARSSKEERKIG